MPWVTRTRVWIAKKRKKTNLSVVTVGTNTSHQAKHYLTFGTGSALPHQGEMPGEIHCPR